MSSCVCGPAAGCRVHATRDPRPCAEREMLGAGLSSSGAGLSVSPCSDGICQVVPGVSIADVGQSVGTRPLR